MGSTLPAELKRFLRVLGNPQASADCIELAIQIIADLGRMDQKRFIAMMQKIVSAHSGPAMATERLD